jgi:hypothetical protein
MSCTQSRSWSTPLSPAKAPRPTRFTMTSESLRAFQQAIHGLGVSSCRINTPVLQPDKLQDAWRVLDVSPGTTWGEVRSRYCRLAKRYHPDLAPNAEDYSCFLRLQEAYRAVESYYTQTLTCSEPAS